MRLAGMVVTTSRTVTGACPLKPTARMVTGPVVPRTTASVAGNVAPSVPSGKVSSALSTPLSFFTEMPMPSRSSGNLRFVSMATKISPGWASCLAEHAVANDASNASNASQGSEGKANTQRSQGHGHRFEVQLETR